MTLLRFHIEHPVADAPSEVTVERAMLIGGESLQQAAFSAGLKIGGACGGLGICTTCRVKILSGDAGRPTREEKEMYAKDLLPVAYRLACQTVPQSDVVAMIDT
ncbi:MAG: (2Fe-2S)-binding protein [Rhizobacter sp.]|nr:(2Fe-2S)-binding protein [Chlorobiales bacterium]